ncbi:MAG: glycerate kinase [Fusobacteriia bacterium 4572_74]|nr:MAG: glycerate kinase [Fusobacteriia bacterium 4572_74]
MKIVIAIDSFKGSLSSFELGEAIEKGIKRVYSDAEVKKVPIADGGEGTVEALVDGTGGRFVDMEVKGPLMKPIDARYGIMGNDKTAVIEMASASGLPLIKLEERNPRKTTTYGTGELIKDAIQKGCREFIIGIGGSATNDAGLGMLQALGYKFFDKKGRKLGAGGEIMEQELGKDVAEIPGAGAAGGLGGGFLAFLEGELRPGIDIVFEKVKLAQEIEGADFVITGEGRIDFQSVMGKAPTGVSKLCQKYGIPVIAIAGCVADDADAVHDYGIEALFSAINYPISLEEAMSRDRARTFVEKNSEEIFRLIRVCEKKFG